MPVLAANPQLGNAGRPQPQTPTGSSGGPWIRYARSASRVGIGPLSTAFGSGPITQPLPSAPGYARRLVNLNSNTGGTSTTTSAFAADAPWNLFNPIQFKDPWGTPVITGDGYSILYVAAKYSGQMGVLAAADRGSLPSFSTTTASGAGSGGFVFNSGIPQEGTKGYGVISIGNASVMPTLLAQIVPSSTFYSTAPSTLGTPQCQFDWEYYDVDPSNPVAPPGNGTTFQLVVVQGNQTVGASSSTRVQLPRTGGYLTVDTFIVRDSNNARQDAFNSTGRIRLYVDGVPRFDDTFLELQDRMYEDFQTARPTGVIAYNFKDSLARLQLGLLDTLECAMQTNPGTLIELEVTPWGSQGTGPYTVSNVQIQVVPAGMLAQGLVEA